MNSESEKASQQYRRNERSLSSISHSPRSEKFCSASKSLKAFEESLRKQDSNHSKDDIYSSPLKKRLNFGKNDQPQSKSKEKTYFVDTLKKIKKIESPFIEKPQNQIFQDKIEASEANLLISCFDSISEKVDGESSNEQELVKSNQNKFQCGIESIHEKEKIALCEEILSGNYHQDPLEVAIFHESNEALMDIEINNEGSEKIEKMEEERMIEKKEESSVSSEFQSESLFPSSSIGSSIENKSEESIRRKKQLKIKKRKDKKNLAKKMKIKLRNITNFVDELHQKKAHTDRKELVSELSEHLWETKFTRLRKELKKLI